MSLHVAIDTGCNLGCTYCYEEGDRDVRGNEVVSDYDMEAIMEQLRAWKQKHPNQIPGLHGGEPLLLRDEDIERLFEWVYENYPSVKRGERTSHIQTNGTLITQKHVEMFREYNVHVGISVDGPVDLNKERVAREGGEDLTDRMSERTHANLERCIEAGCSVGVITVLHKANAGDEEKLEKLLDWMDWLNRQGVSGHFNPAIPYEDIQTELSLNPERLKEVYLRTWEWMKEEDYRRWNPMLDYVDNLLGNQLSNCVNDRCDVFNAGAAKIVDGEGETTGCGKTAGMVGDGVMFLQGDSNSSAYDDADERYEMLKQVPQEEGGCRGCPYWNVCTGGCPSAGMEQDWRNRTRWCEAKKALYERIEDDLRALLPNITLITDFPWNAELDKKSTRWDLDIQPFAAMRPGTPGKSSSYGGYEGAPGLQERVPEEVWPEEDEDEVVRRWEEQHGAENVSHHADEGDVQIHADSEHTDVDGALEVDR